MSKKVYCLGENTGCNHCQFSNEDDLCDKGHLERQPGKAGFASQCPDFKGEQKRLDRPQGKTKSIGQIIGEFAYDKPAYDFSKEEKERADKVADHIHELYLLSGYGKAQGLGRPDREQILDIICDHRDGCDFKGKGCFDPDEKCPLAEKANQTLDLFPKPLRMPELREALAELEHKQWIEWASSIIRTEAISKERGQRWQRLMIPYNQLTEEQKDQDRIWADKSLALFPDCVACTDRFISDHKEAISELSIKVEEAKQKDRPKLREKIEALTETICFAVRAYERFDISREEFELIDKSVTEDLLALIPDIDQAIQATLTAYESTCEALIEEAKIIAYGKGVEDCTDNNHSLFVDNAKKQERQRVMDILQKEYPAIDTWQCWQALGEK